MSTRTLPFTLTGAAGPLECLLERPDPERHPAPRGIALIAHPHPLFGGTMDNKVTTTLARTFTGIGYVAVRMNFRGVGASAGAHDEGRGETDDMELLLNHVQAQYPGLPVAL